MSARKPLGTIRLTRNVRDPLVYLSSSEGKFRVIEGGMPISADKPTAAEALAAAAYFGLKVSAELYWDGDAGEWRAR